MLESLSVSDRKIELLKLKEKLIRCKTNLEGDIIVDNIRVAFQQKVQDS